MMKRLPLLALLLPLTAHSAEHIELLDWWTSGGEARAASVLQQHWQEQGNRWRDGAVAGGGGSAAMLVLRSRILANNPPDAAHLKNAELHEWAARGLIRELNTPALPGLWERKFYPFVVSTLDHQGKMVAIPLGIHRINWLWVNQPLFDHYQLQPPRNWDEFTEVAEQLQLQGVRPLAIGNDPWQLGILFEAIALGEGGSDFFRRAFVNLEPDTLQSQQMQAILRRFHGLRRFLPTNAQGMSWNQATHMVMRGEAAMQLMGDWVKSEWLNQPDTPPLRCLPAPGSAGRFSYNLDAIALLAQPDNRQQQAQDAFSSLLLSETLQQEFNRRKGSIPPQPQINLQGFDQCSQDAVRALQQAMQQGDLVPSMVESATLNPAVQQVILELLSNYFNDADASSHDAAQQLARVVQAVSSTIKNNNKIIYIQKYQ